MTGSVDEPGSWIVEVSDECISSMQCIMTAPDLFAMNDDGYSSAIHESVGIDRSDDLRQAVDGCPVGAIRITRR